ncbi:hypothetical protein N7533_009093 [Penicillium manginii]|jgi:hypothetical protein|uniref:uncharacterized protein n=1 Tax=Penicillium manginii TaxID=203109 RepID=UPI0025478753|nr:uncharacterized protein N7533_009093 [Penicillium manginii]KAJ5744223.1 hypothetical protein N7533_009093 [Penicillium manginii]
MRTLRAKYYRERHAKPRRFSALWGKLYHLRAALFGFKTPTPPNIEETGEPSTNQTRLGFLEAFQRVKEVALEDHGTNITSAVILFPRFFSREVQNLVVEAAREVGIMPLFQESPDWLLSRFENILEPNPTIEKAARPQKLLIIDYGIWHFDVRTYGSRCKLNYPIDSMGSAKIIFKLANRLKSTNMDIQQQLAQGASFDTLVKAVHQSRWLMKMDIGVDLSDEEASKKEVPEKWPLDLDDWWIGQKKESFIYWDDMRSVEAEYVSELAETLDDLHNCLKGKKRNPVILEIAWCMPFFGSTK